MKTMQYDLPPDATPELAEILKHHCRLRFVDGLWRCNSIDSYTLLKQSINNTFSKYCDRRVLCVTKDASRQFQFPCKIFKDIAARRLRYSPTELEEVFQTHLQELNAVLCRVEAQKVDMTWPSYQQFVRENIEYAFSHYKDPEVLNAEHPSTTAPPSLYSYLTTSNYAVKYIGKTIRKNMLHLQQTAIGRGNWRAEYVLCPKCGHGYVQPGKRSCPLCRKTVLRKSICKECGLLFDLPQRGGQNKYCSECYPKMRKSAIAAAVRKHRNAQCNQQ